MKKKVLVYEKDKVSLEFLKDSFKGNPTFSASFFTNVRDFKKTIGARPPYAIIVGSPECLERLKHPTGDTPVIAMVSTDVTRGMRSVVRNDIEYYLLRPYLKSDLRLQAKGPRQEVSLHRNPVAGKGRPPCRGKPHILLFQHAGPGGDTLHDSEEDQRDNPRNQMLHPER